MVKRLILVAIRRHRYNQIWVLSNTNPLYMNEQGPGCTGITSKSVGSEPEVYVVY